MTIEVRMEVSKTVNAKSHYIAQTLGITVRRAYELIMIAFLDDHDLDDAVGRIKLYTHQKVDPAAPVGSETGPVKD